MIYDCIIIGAGAAGLYCASEIVSKRDLKIAVMDPNHQPGKKLLLTGAGRCNFTNSSIDPDSYFSDDPAKLRDILSSHDHEAFLSFAENELGVVADHKDELYYPRTYRSNTFVNALFNYLTDHKVTFIFDTAAEELIHDNGIYVINGRYQCRTVVIATGGMSYPKTGSTGAAIRLISSLGSSLRYNEFQPSLVPLTTAEKDTHKISGAKVKCDLTLYDDVHSEVLSRSSGELLFTDYGVSGICVLDISGHAVRYMDQSGKEPVLSACLLPGSEKIIGHMISLYPGRRVIDALNGLIRDDLLNVILKRSGVNRDTLCSALSRPQISAIGKTVSDFRFTVTGNKGFEHAQVSTGGVLLSCLDDDLRLDGTDGVFICGEAVNVDGICGGYNLQFAWSSAYRAACGVIKCLN